MLGFFEELCTTRTVMESTWVGSPKQGLRQCLVEGYHVSQFLLDQPVFKTRDSGQQHAETPDKIILTERPDFEVLGN